MYKTYSEKTSYKMPLSSSQFSNKLSNDDIGSKHGENRFVSSKYLQDRESIYRLVDIIDRLFDGVIETDKA
jgi:hypothetical protein